jgi:hypothetical protein
MGSAKRFAALLADAGRRATFTRFTVMREAKEAARGRTPATSRYVESTLGLRVRAYSRFGAAHSVGHGRGRG